MAKPLSFKKFIKTKKINPKNVPETFAFLGFARTIGVIKKLGLKEAEEGSNFVLIKKQNNNFVHQGSQLGSVLAKGKEKWKNWHGDLSVKDLKVHTTFTTKAEVQDEKAHLKAHYRREDHVENLHNDLVKHYKFGEQAGENHEIAKIHSYADSSRYMNHWLHHGDLHPSQERNLESKNDRPYAIAENEKKRDNMAAICRKHTTPKDFTVHTGAKFDPRDHITPEAHKAGYQPIHLKAFTSTSIDNSKSRGFGLATKHGEENHQHVVSIHIPKGSHGAYIDHHSTWAGEKEFVLHHGAKIHLDPKPNIKKLEGNHYKTDSNGEPITHQVFWKARLVHDGIKDV